MMILLNLIEHTTYLQRKMKDQRRHEKQERQKGGQIVGSDVSLKKHNFSSSDLKKNLQNS